MKQKTHPTNTTTNNSDDHDTHKMTPLPPPPPSFTAQCTQCPFSSDYDTVFRHGVEAHKIYICVCCSTQYSHANELATHMCLQHRVPSQHYSDVHQFIKCGGQETLLCCVECSTFFDIGDEGGDDEEEEETEAVEASAGPSTEGAQVNGGKRRLTDSSKLEAHHCRETTITCDYCAEIVAVRLVSLHIKTCPGLKPRKDGSPPKKLRERVTVIHRERKTLEQAMLLKNMKNERSDVSVTLVSNNEVEEKLPKVNGNVKHSVNKPNGLVNGGGHHHHYEDDDEEEDRLVIDENEHSKPLQAPKSRRNQNYPAATPEPRVKRAYNRRSATNKITPPAQPPPQEELTSPTSYGRMERPRRTLKKITNDDFVFETVAKRRSYQRSSSRTSEATTPTSPFTPTGRRPRLSSSNPATTIHQDDEMMDIQPNQIIQIQSIEETSPRVQTIKLKLSDIQMYRSMYEHSENPYGDSDDEDGDEEEEEEDTKPDPLLEETDPAKRLLLLIEELGNKLSKQWPPPCMPGYTVQEPDDSTYELILNHPIEELTAEDEVLSKMLKETAVNCTYCRQVKLISIDKRQLSIHLLSKHFWVVKIGVTNSPPVVKEEVEESNKAEEQEKLDSPKTADTITSNEKDESPKTNTDTITSNEKDESLKTNTDTITSSENDDHSILLEQEKLASPEPTTTTAGENSTIKLEQEEIKSPQQVLLNESEPMDTTDPTISDDNKTAEEVAAADEKVDQVVVAVKVDWTEFRQTILKKVFLSSSNLFTYKDSDELVQFGETECECLLCGMPVDTQKNLFPHWRKLHRGVAMKCAMCQGRFLFAGALFSHLCFGTPIPVIKNEAEPRSQQQQHTGGKNPPMMPSSVTDSPMSLLGGGEVQVVDPREDDGSADTIVLRYQCNICDNVQLPGFFNYMVHLRKEHNRCELCLETMANQKELEHHMKKHKLNHFCWKCGVTYCAKPNFMTHLLWKHGCESKECSFCLKKKWPHIYHFCVPPQFFSCEICGFYFTKAKCLVVHRRLHTGEKMRKCPTPDCQESFVSKKLLDRHIQNVHGNQLNQPSTILALTEKGEDATTKKEEEDITDKAETDVKKEEEITRKEEEDLTDKKGEDVIKKEEEEKEQKTETVEDLVDPIKSEIEPAVEEKESLKEPTEEKDIEMSEIINTKTTNDADATNEMSKPDLEKASSSASPTILIENKTITEEEKVSSIVDKTDEQPIKEEEEVEKQSNDPTPTKSTKEHKIKSSKKRKDSGGKSFNIEEVHGPNLSEDESGPDESADEHDESSDHKDSTPDTSFKKDEEVVPTTTPAVTTEHPMNPLLPPMDDDMNGDNDLLSGIDEKIIKDAPEDIGSMSPLLAPLDDFNFNVPDIPTFEDNSLPEHIIRENAIFSLLNEHDYCLRQSLKRGPSSPIVSSSRCSRSKKKLKTMKKSHSQRKRSHRSSSSSSSSTCGSNCSCSSSSSSSSSSSGDSSSEDESQNNNNNVSPRRPMNYPIQKMLLPPTPPSGSNGTPVKRGRGRPKGSVNRNKDGIPTAKKYRMPGGAGKRIGKIIVPKSPRQLNPDGSPQKRKYKKQKGKFSRKSAQHHENGGQEFPEENYLLETDLETDESGSEEVYEKKQFSEVIGRIPDFDEIWTMPNEEYLFKIVRGVKRKPHLH